MNIPFNNELDLSLTRIIKAPRSVVWNAWTTPSQLEQWWIPKPAKCRVIDLDLRPGGAFVTQMSENGGAFAPHVNGSFLAVEPGRQLVFTDSLLTNWRPSAHPFMTAIITLRDHSEGTEYLAHVMHKDNATRNKHDQLGFSDGWGTVAAQLAELVE